MGKGATKQGDLFSYSRVSTSAYIRADSSQIHRVQSQFEHRQVPCLVIDQDDGVLSALGLLSSP